MKPNYKVSFGVSCDTFVKQKSGYTPQDIAKAELEFLEQNKNLTLEDNIDLFKGIHKREFDINKLMAIAADNSLRKNGNAYILGEETPEIFEGLDKKQLADDITEILSKENIIDHMYYYIYHHHIPY